MTVHPIDTYSDAMELKSLANRPMRLPDVIRRKVDQHESAMTIYGSLMQRMRLPICNPGLRTVRFEAQAREHDIFSATDQLQ